MSGRDPELVLGSVQWGLRYGIANASGQPDTAEVAKMLARASAAGLRWIDTARAYGEAEQVIGQLSAAEPARWRVVTKVAPSLEPEPLPALHASLAASRQALGRERLDVVLLHRPEHRELPGVWEALLEQREQGSIGALGISATTPEQAWAALEQPSIEQLQVASSILDQRLASAGFFARARAAGKTVHVRSVYLQGVAFLELERLPAHLEGLREPLRTLDELARAHACPRARLFLQYARSLGADGLVLGCEALWQLDSNLQLWGAPPIPELQTLLDEGLCEQLGRAQPHLVDPSRWPRP